MALWQIGDRPASVVGDPSTYAPSSSSSTSGSPVIVYPNSDGTTGGSQYNYTGSSNSSSDPYGGTPISINVGNSAEGLNSLSGVLNSGFSGLFDLISQNTDKNNAWSAAQAQKQMDFQERMNNIAMEFNSLEAAKNRDWQMMMSNSAHQREIADLKAAGLNPVLSASGGNGAAVTSGATASGVTSSGAKGETDTSANQAMVALYGSLLNAQVQMANANLSAKTNLEIADKQMRASMYGANLAAETARMNSPMQLYNGIVSFLTNQNNDTPTGKGLQIVENAVSGTRRQIQNDPEANKKMSFKDAKNYLASTPLGKLLRW